MSSQATNIQNCRMTPSRLEILRLLVEYRALSTRQVYSGLQLKAHHKTLRRVQSDLSALRSSGFIEAFPIFPEAGPRSEFGWHLRMSGARVVGFEIGFDNQYRQKPDPKQLEQTGWKLQLEAGVRRCQGWSLIKPLTPRQMRSPEPLTTAGAGNGAFPFPEGAREIKTPQYHKLTEVLSWQSFHQTGRWPVEGLEGPQALGIPLTANDYLAFTPPRPIPARHDGSGKASENAVVFILCPYDSTRKFWQNRLVKYEQISDKVLVFGVFDNDNRALSYKKLLQKEGLRVTTFSRVELILDGQWKQLTGN